MPPRTPWRGKEWTSSLAETAGYTAHRCTTSASIMSWVSPGTARPTPAANPQQPASAGAYRALMRTGVQFRLETERKAPHIMFQPKQLTVELYEGSVPSMLQLADLTGPDLNEILAWFEQYRDDPTPPTNGSLWLRNGKFAVWSIGGQPTH